MKNTITNGKSTVGGVTPSWTKPIEKAKKSFKKHAELQTRMRQVQQETRNAFKEICNMNVKVDVHLFKSSNTLKVVVWDGTQYDFIDLCLDSFVKGSQTPKEIAQDYANFFMFLQSQAFAEVTATSL